MLWLCCIPFFFIIKLYIDYLLDPIPGPLPLPFIGNVLDCIKSSQHPDKRLHVKEEQEKWGAIKKIYLPTSSFFCLERCVYIHRPKDLEILLKIHFNHLMNEIHNSINKQNKNEKNLEKFVKKLSLDFKILFIDELHIFNIVDALIIKKIFLLFKKYKIFVIISSNFHPNELNKQVERFLAFF